MMECECCGEIFLGALQTFLSHAIGVGRRGRADLCNDLHEPTQALVRDTRVTINLDVSG
jgi:hypothetical protein